MAVGLGRPRFLSQVCHLRERFWAPRNFPNRTLDEGPGQFSAFSLSLCETSAIISKLTNKGSSASTSASACSASGRVGTLRCAYVGESCSVRRPAERGTGEHRCHNRAAAAPRSKYLNDSFRSSATARVTAATLAAKPLCSNTPARLSSRVISSAAVQLPGADGDVAVGAPGVSAAARICGDSDRSPSSRVVGRRAGASVVRRRAVPRAICFASSPPFSVPTVYAPFEYTGQPFNDRLGAEG